MKTRRGYAQARVMTGRLIVTNHVVEGATVITVVMPDNSTAKARLVGADPQTDLAVLRIPGRNYPAVSLGVTKDVEVGETVVAIGSALGLPGGPTVTTGTVSALGRAETEPGDEATNSPGARLYDLLQTDTAINPGNSGGPLLNTEGKVVGVNTLGQRATSTGIPVQGINFAISVDTVRDVSAEIIRTGRVVYPYIGITGRFLYPQVSIIESLPMVLGQRVESVEPGTPAEKVGFRRGDVILAIDGTKIIDESTFIRLLRAKNPGDSARFTIWRDGRTLQRELVLATRPNSP
ncbi:MAG: trypsin-like peptidase domain-containing protein [Chloroflexia bacterium]